MLSPRLNAYFADYANYHHSRGNKTCHYLGIPMIMVAALGLLSAVKLGRHFDAGLLLVALSALWYVTLEWRITGPFVLFALGLYFLGCAIPAASLWVLFVTGWIMQFVGHGVFEKKSPAFLKNAAHLLIGPLWVFSSLTGNLTDMSHELPTERHRATS